MAAGTVRPRVYTLPPGARFLDVLADAVLGRRLVPGPRPLDDPLSLADITIFLPTRRACRALEAVFVAKSLHGALLLPRIAPLGDVDEDDEAFSGDDGLAPDLPPPLSPLERQLTLARLVRAWAERLAETRARQEPGAIPLTPRAPADALALAADLGALIDSVETEEVDWNAFSRLVPDDYDEVWRLTAEFLAIAITAWPQHLKEIGRCDPAWRRSRALRALAADMAANPPKGPVIAAGSTGSIPATAALLAAIARLPMGAVVLPGLDTVLDDPSWEQLVTGDDARAFTHPQRGLARLLQALDVARGDVMPLGEPPVPERVALLSSALRPAETTEHWADAPLDGAAAERALHGVTIVEAANEREEALAVAALVREALETPGRTVAVVTPDRALARRVSGELGRWGIEAEDSAGRPLGATGAGVFARLLLAAAGSDLAPLDLLALLKHPLARFGHTPDALRRAVETLELRVLRGPAPPPGIEGLRLALQASGIDGEERASINALLEECGAALGPLVQHGDAALDVWAARLRDAIARASAGTDAARIDEDVAALLALLDEVGAAGTAFPLARHDALPSLTTLMLGRPARPAPGGHRRVAILGLLEARLVGADRLVLAGLNEGIWPPETRSDPWLSRPMRRQIGLPPPERRIGLAAHDFAQALAHADVVVTRSLKNGGVPATMARWLQRIQAVTGKEAWNAAAARGGDMLATVRRLDDAPYIGPVAAPVPKPPLPLRPSQLSVTEIETLLRDPYSIYARRILKLRRLDPAALAPGVADKGTLIHKVLADYVRENIDPFADGARARLIALGERAFDELTAAPDLQALWRARFVRIVDWFLAFERGRAEGIAARHAERAGELAWTTSANRRFLLKGVADRIDRRADGRYAVLDYKTGTPPTAKEVHSGIAPQLPLEAAMLALGGFPGIAPGEVGELVYVRLSGGDPAGEATEVGNRDGLTPTGLAEETLTRLKELIDRFEDAGQPYTSLDHPKFRRRANGDYDHLARVREWSLGGEDGGAS